jgi:hypothetical protein
MHVTHACRPGLVWVAALPAPRPTPQVNPENNALPGGCYCADGGTCDHTRRPVSPPLGRGRGNRAGLAEGTPSGLRFEGGRGGEHSYPWSMNMASFMAVASVPA